jgi:hypothetical protein
MALPWRKECVWNHICQDSIVTQSWRMFSKGCQILQAPLSWLFIYLCYLLLLLLFIISIFVKSQLYLFLNLHEFLVIMWCGIRISLGVFAIFRRICDKFSTLVLFHKQFRAHKKKLECSFYLLFFVSEHTTFKISHNKNLSQWKMCDVTCSFSHFLYI